MVLEMFRFNQSILNDVDEVLVLVKAAGMALPEFEFAKEDSSRVVQDTIEWLRNKNRNYDDLSAKEIVAMQT
jgi:hypothetical protein